jgi:hypothetical protein
MDGKKVVSPMVYQKARTQRVNCNLRWNNRIISREPKLNLCDSVLNLAQQTK